MEQLELVRLRHVSEQLDVSVGTVRRWGRQGRLALVRLPSGGLRIRREDLDRIVARANIDSPAP